MATVEDVILSYSRRGMTLLRPYLPKDYCGDAADEILSWPKGGTVLLTTGFFVDGQPETDGPAGTVSLAHALRRLGLVPVFVCEKFGLDYFSGFEVEVVSVEDGPDRYQAILDKHEPVGIVAIERCGINENDDYANMRGVSVAPLTSKVDYLFELSQGRIPSIGVGDGGNEIGMGSLLDAIHDELPICPCRTKVDRLVIATVSNWGAYGIVARLQEKTRKSLLPSFVDVRSYLRRTVALGSVDGVTKENIVGVDGFSLDEEAAVLRALEKVASI
ncbi:MAG: DUF4392 domain-containing protein [Coriobacteriia bacterium]|nr:DUF4392 domain-containing protein [Coriobacteriia bacterium]